MPLEPFGLTLHLQLYTFQLLNVSLSELCESSQCTHIFQFFVNIVINNNIPHQYTCLFFKRLQQEQKKQQELERQLEKQRQIEQQREEERRKALEQREVMNKSKALNAGNN